MPIMKLIFNIWARRIDPVEHAQLILHNISLLPHYALAYIAKQLKYANHALAFHVGQDRSKDIESRYTKCDSFIKSGDSRSFYRKAKDSKQDQPENHAI